METVTVKNANGEVINTNVPHDLAVSMLDTGECYVKHDPAFFPIKTNAEPGVIYKSS